MRTLHRITLACLILAACAPSPEPGPPARRTSLLAQCSSREGPAGTDSAVANNAGEATLQVRGAAGQHVLHVPAGAAEPGTVFILTAMAPPNVGVEAHVRGQGTYSFLNGRRATLRIDAEHCTTEEYGKLPSPTILRVGRDGALTPLPSRPGEGGARSLSAELPTLSGYAIGSN
ncbi:MAG TPA: hypothetical protein VF584_13515 [Longimicrobium sp.]|jgi:hypothetical protein